MKSYARKGMWSTSAIGLYTIRENPPTRME